MKTMANSQLMKLAKRMDDRFQRMDGRIVRVERDLGVLAKSVKALGGEVKFLGKDVKDLRKDTKGLLDYVVFLDSEFQTHRTDATLHAAISSRSR